MSLKNKELSSIPNENDFQPQEERTHVPQEQVLEVRSQLSALAAEVDDDTVRRFIRATGGNIPLAVKRLNTTSEWRAQVKPELMVCKACAKKPGSHYMHVVGFCKQSRPLVLSCAALAQNRVHDDNKEHLIQCFESAVKCMSPGVEQWVWICDFHGFGLSDVMNPGIAKTFLDLSGSHYPERLGLFLGVDPPSVFSMLWRAIQSFIDPKTYKKIKFIPYDVVSPQSKLKAELERWFDAETVAWLLADMAENRDKAKIKSKVYNFSAVHKAASMGQLLSDVPSPMTTAATTANGFPPSTVHDSRGTRQLLKRFESCPRILEPQATAVLNT
ncbi:hypothetical protein CEUSTIGMA_g1857.t1 [Chlamydomonas eustigma]|uniref:CRAL-TRIO domain-containing protein n=1 Tax=Chlamydomonas eustigma TaxID=1157962 RepID=A0A250WUM0_9CHLO|nr:hypothetical protein CEUSTIGMA_g1857.t1 [Chlamydomonas eustigma]|eukprot:GAX74409.1 hypothetical protein CEUSTIGMA_g1857.t1 [Chlamydomonas eustigma]